MLKLYNDAAKGKGNSRLFRTKLVNSLFQRNASWQILAEVGLFRCFSIYNKLIVSEQMQLFSLQTMSIKDKGMDLVHQDSSIPKFHAEPGHEVWHMRNCRTPTQCDVVADFSGRQ